MSYILRTYQVAFRQILRLLLWAVFACFFCISCSKGRTAKELQIAEDLLWSRPDSCLAFLDELDYSAMSEHDSLVCALIRVHALFKIEYGVEDDSMLHVLRNYFEAHEDHRYAGEANYIIGRNLVLRQNLPLSTFYLKEAEEHLLKAEETPCELLGMVYYGLGSSAEYERLFKIANEYYKMALPYFLQTSDSIYISCTYRDIANTDTLSESTIAWLDTAFMYLPVNTWQGYQLELEKIRLKYPMQTDAEQYLPIYQTLCDSLHQYRLAIEICQYYLGEHKLDSVPYYLSLAEQDTANSVWSKEHYLFNKAWYKYEIGQKDSAYFILRDLHLWQTAEIESSAYTRSYMVEQRYDAERERADMLLAQAGKRRAHLIIAIVCVSALLLCSMLIISWMRERAKKRNEEEQNRQLKEELRHKRQRLQEQLRMRLKISAELKKQKSQGQNFSGDAYEQLMSSIVYIITPKQWTPLIEEFDIAYAGLLSELAKRYEKLTEIDMLYILLILLGCSNNEISELVNVSAQSVRNRKMLIKEHVGCSTNIEEWLRKEAENRNRQTASL